VTRRGYDPEQVHRFLRAVADHLDRLQGETDRHRARVEHVERSNLERSNLELQRSVYDRMSGEFVDGVRGPRRVPTTFGPMPRIVRERCWPTPGGKRTE
jgi:hypothetical protein